MHISVDFDRCYRRDPDTWANVVDMFEQNGHRCFLITKRRGDDPERVQEVRDTVTNDIPIIFAGRHYKDDVAQHYDIDIDVWIDDHPEFIRSPSNLKRRLMNAKRKTSNLRRLIQKMSDMMSTCVSHFESILD